jgi:hypothetical protein
LDCLLFQPSERIYGLLEQFLDRLPWGIPAVGNESQTAENAHIEMIAVKT